MPRTKKPKRLSYAELHALVTATNLRTSVAIQHQNDLFGRIEKLEAAPKQSPTERGLLARVAALEGRMNAHNQRLAERQAAKADRCERFWGTAQAPQPPKCERELALERHCEWLKQQLEIYRRIAYSR